MDLLYPSSHYLSQHTLGSREYIHSLASISGLSGGLTCVCSSKTNLLELNARYGVSVSILHGFVFLTVMHTIVGVLRGVQCQGLRGYSNRSLSVPDTLENENRYSQVRRIALHDVSPRNRLTHVREEPTP